MLRKSFAALGAAAIILLATPVAASAATGVSSASCVGGDYASAGVVTADHTTINGGESVTVNYQGGYFAPGSPVTVGTSGSGAAGSQFTPSGVADANGDMSVTVTSSTNAAGSLVISATSECAVGGVSVTVLDKAAPAAKADRAAKADTSAGSLAFTGSTVPVVLILTGAGALAFGSILLVARARTRRRLQQ